MAIFLKLTIIIIKFDQSSVI